MPSSAALLLAALWLAAAALTHNYTVSPGSLAEPSYLWMDCFYVFFPQRGWTKSPDCSWWCFHRRCWWERWGTVTLIITVLMCASYTFSHLSSDNNILHLFPSCSCGWMMTLTFSLSSMKIWYSSSIRNSLEANPGQQTQETQWCRGVDAFFGK